MLSDFITYLENKEINQDDIREFRCNISRYLKDFSNERWEEEMIKKTKFDIMVTFSGDYPKSFPSTYTLFIKNYKPFYDQGKFQFTIYTDNKEKVEEYLNYYLDHPKITYL